MMELFIILFTTCTLGVVIVGVPIAIVVQNRQDKKKGQWS